MYWSLYDILNEFPKGGSHMAAVVNTKGKSKALPPTIDGEKAVGMTYTGGDSQLTTPLFSRMRSPTVLLLMLTGFQGLIM